MCRAAPTIRNVAIQRVGVKSMRTRCRLPRRPDCNPPIATVDMYVALPAHQKGTHMSRFIEALQNHRVPLSVQSMRELMRAMLARLEATTARSSSASPISLPNTRRLGVASLLDYDVTLRVEAKAARSGRCRSRGPVTSSVRAARRSRLRRP